MISSAFVASKKAPSARKATKQRSPGPDLKSVPNEGVSPCECEHMSMVTSTTVHMYVDTASGKDTIKGKPRLSDSKKTTSTSKAPSGQQVAAGCWLQPFGF